MNSSKVGLIRKVFFIVKFILKNRYLPNLINPISFNEKILYRILNSNNDLYSICSDKIEVKNYLIKNGLKDIIIPNLFISDKVTITDIKSALDKHTEMMLKANHNSGPVFFITKKTSESDLVNAVENVNNQLKVDYGNRYGESWYSNIKPKVFIEKLIKTNDGVELRDYKFHCFKRVDGSFEIVLHIDFDRTTNHTRTYFDESLNALPISSYAPSVISKIEQPKNYKKMLEIAKRLAAPFDYVRVDLYNVDGDIYFGELTFAQGAGLSRFETKEQDLLLGSKWNIN
ncbi:glycosyltransferase [Aliivibrio fischeri]|uniref:Glycosyltransferase n=1 Tax=Aliivibrio fischeri TaxID=668 RepID=A0A6N3Z2H2_ALIFS|nr:ATP-grasp fold amidoligase family protein [Aliivibrio fischeri]MUK46111.1 glycosyltransferase [Aliivibrio fischeri]MUK79245.1 glycosyltransferase [Aliivibrio fischeri]MUK85887.1 glycosyltransferase [Aliivibrio fischeri]